MFARLDLRFADARPLSDKDGWRACVGGALSVVLTLGVLVLLFVQRKAQYKSLKFIEPDQVTGSIDDLVGGMANEELFFGGEGTTNGAHNDITRVTLLLYHAVGEMGMYRKTRLNFGSLAKDRSGGGRDLDDETRSLMEAQSECLYSKTKAVLQALKPLTEHLVGRLLQAG